MGFHHKIRLHSNATAAIGIAWRRGMGKIRHLDCTDLWIQEKVRSGAAEVVKVPGTENPADAFTEYVDRKTLLKALEKFNLKTIDGRAKCAPDTLGLR